MSDLEGTVYADCPCCGARLEVRRKDGKVVEHWKKRPEPASEEDALKAEIERQKTEKAKRDHWLSGAKERLEKSKREAQEKFDKERERIMKEKDFTRPENPFDLD